MVNKNNGCNLYVNNKLQYRHKLNGVTSIAAKKVTGQWPA